MTGRSADPTIAVIGLGPMGAPVAGHLAGAGHRTSVWNRTASVAEQLASSAAGSAMRAVPEPGDLVAEVVFTALPDVEQFDAVVGDPVLERWARTGTRVVVVLSTTSVDKVRALGERLRPYRITVVDAPMSGGDSGARAGTLSLMVGADDRTFAELEPVFRAFATTVERLGPLGAGTAAKLCNQVVVAGTLAALAEAIELADAAGLDTVQVVRVLEGGLASSAVLRAKQRNLVDHDHRPGGSLRNQVKDLDHALALAASVGAWTPQTTAARATFGTALDAGMGDLDHSAVQEVLVPAGSSHRYGSITKADGSANDSTNS